MSDTIIVALIVATPATILGICTLFQGRRTHDTFNSKMDKLLQVTADLSYLRGQQQEKHAEQKRAEEKRAEEKRANL